MKTSDISLLEIQDRQNSLAQIAFKTKSGPHHDLLAMCDFATITDQETVGNQLYVALSSTDAKARVAAARQAVELSKGTCGLAWLVLAREGVNSADSAMIYSQRAVDRIKEELHGNNNDHDASDDYGIFNDTYTVVLAEAAAMAFNAGRVNDAISMLKNQLNAEITDEFNSDCQFILREQLVSLFLQSDSPKEAQNILHEQPDNIESWHYLNALAQFSLHGDDLLSRSALTSAFKSGTITAQKLLGNFPIFDHKSDHFDQIISIEIAVAAWLKNKEALAWAKEIINDPRSLIARESVVSAVQNKDKKRWELWDNRETTAAYFMDTENFKEAIKEFKSALKEAERIDYSYFPFFNTTTGLLAINQEVEMKLDDFVKEKVEQRVQRINQSVTKDGLTALHYHSLAQIYRVLDDLSAALTCQTKALQIAEIVIEGRTITLAELVEIKQAMAEIMYEQEDYAKALLQSQEACALQERYLGSQHYDLLVSLELAHDCCQKLGDQANMAALKNKMKAIEPFAFG